MDERNSRYELQTARNGLSVPVIDGVYLHSIYNPTKEAATQAKMHESSLKTKNYVLVLGLGFGYHIEEIAKILNQYHAHYKIVILEPNETLVENFKQIRNFEDQNIRIYCAPVDELFESWEFINFLSHKPSLIKHDASYSLEHKYFKEFLEYKAPTSMESLQKLSNDDAYKLYLGRDEKNFIEAINTIKTGKSLLTNADFLFMALNEIKNITYQGNNNE
ncbi:MAG: hypothetical protein HON90_05385 [Halobacteriovoraceae bacterium]|jgi:hypothetical protein|nr:hypothetical protein [Halobacteriovoraceae bacterium]